MFGSLNQGVKLYLREHEALRGNDTDPDRAVDSVAWKW